MSSTLIKSHLFSKRKKAYSVVSRSGKNAVIKFDYAPLRRLLQKHKLHVHTVARALGFGFNTATDLTHNREVRLETLALLCAFFDVPINEVVDIVVIDDGAIGKAAEWDQNPIFKQKPIPRLKRKNYKEFEEFNNALPDPLNESAKLKEKAKEKTDAKLNKQLKESSLNFDGKKFNDVASDIYAMMHRYNKRAKSKN